MQILVANPRGFCAGVNMAIDCLEECIRIFGSEIYVYHEIVHNKYVVDRFTREGVTFVDEISDVPRGSVLLYSAHGVSPAIREEAASVTCGRSTPPVRSSPRSTSKRSGTHSRGTTSS